jgi:hypothetical protein
MWYSNTNISSWNCNHHGLCTLRKDSIRMQSSFHSRIFLDTTYDSMENFGSIGKILWSLCRLSILLNSLSISQRFLFPSSEQDKFKPKPIPHFPYSFWWVFGKNCYWSLKYVRHSIADIHWVQVSEVQPLPKYYSFLPSTPL